MERTILKNYKEFLVFRNTLLFYGTKFNIPFEDIEELANDSTIKALNNFIDERGSFESYCKVIFKHKILNFKKTKKDRFLIIILDSEEDFTGKDLFSLDDEERNQNAFNFICKLKVILDDEEQKFLAAVYQVCERSDIKLIAEASKNIEVTNAKGWDIFRRIQRKAMSLFKENEIEKVKDEGRFLYRKSKIIYSEYDENILLFDSIVSEYFNVDKFILNLDNEQLKKLSDLYS